MNYLGLGLIAFGSVLYWLFGKLVGAIGFQNPYANMPEFLRRNPILRYGLYTLPFIVWFVGIVLCFIYSLPLGFVSLAVVVVLWIGLSPLPGQSGANTRVIPREINTKTDYRGTGIGPMSRDTPTKNAKVGTNAALDSIEQQDTKGSQKQKVPIEQIGDLLIGGTLQVVTEDWGKINQNLKMVVQDWFDKVDEKELRKEYWAALISMSLGLADYESGLDAGKRDAIRRCVLQKLKDSPNKVGPIDEVTEYMSDWDNAMEQWRQWFANGKTSPDHYVPLWRWNQSNRWRNQQPNDYGPDVAPQDAIAARFCERMGFREISNEGSEEFLSPTMVTMIRKYLKPQGDFWKKAVEQFKIE